MDYPETCKDYNDNLPELGVAMPFVFGTLTEQYTLMDSNGNEIWCDWPVQRDELKQCMGRMLRVTGDIICNETDTPFIVGLITEIAVYISFRAYAGLWPAFKGFYPQWRIEHSEQSRAAFGSIPDEEAARDPAAFLRRIRRYEDEDGEM